MNLTYEYLRTSNKAIDGLYAQYEVYKEKIERTLQDGSMPKAFQSAKAYDIYIQAVAEASKLFSQLHDGTASEIDKLHDNFIGSTELSMQDAIAIVKEVNSQNTTNQYETLQASAPARKAVAVYEQTMGRGGIAELCQSLEDAFLDTNRDRLKELNEIKSASTALEHSFSEQLEAVFPNFHTAQDIANSRIAD